MRILPASPRPQPRGQVGHLPVRGGHDKDTAQGAGAHRQVRQGAFPDGIVLRDYRFDMHVRGAAFRQRVAGHRLQRGRILPARCLVARCGRHPAGRMVEQQQVFDDRRHAQRGTAYQLRNIGRVVADGHRGLFRHHAALRNRGPAGRRMVHLQGTRSGVHRLPDLPHRGPCRDQPRTVRHAGGRIGADGRLPY